MAPPLRRPNGAKPWTIEEIETLRRLAAAGAEMGAIARQLGRSRSAVAHQAGKIGVGIGKSPAARAVEREEALRRRAEDPPQE